MEIFKDIKGYPNYQISNKGRVWNVRTQRMLKPSQKENGYYQINLVAINGKRKKEYIHRLIALTFIDNPNNYTEVNHIDRDKGNNVLENLEWCDRKHNMRNTSANKPLEVYDLNGNLLYRFGSLVECAEALNGSVQGIYSYLYGKTNSPYLKKFIIKETK